MEVIQRFPKWLTLEEFDLHHDPTAAHCFTISLYGKSGTTASGWTIGEAAKLALERREARKKAT